MIAITTNHDFRNNRIAVHCNWGLFRFPIQNGLSLEENRDSAVKEINKRFYQKHAFNQIAVIDYPNKRDKKIHIIELC